MNIDSEFVGKLVCGSKNINQMRQEIEMLVPMLVSLSRKCVEYDKEYAHDKKIGNDSIGDFFWEIKYKFKPGMGLETWVQCYRKDSYAFRGANRSCMYTLNGLACDSKDVQNVWKSLPQLVKGMIELLPGLKKELQPFLAAADAFKSAA